METILVSVLVSERIWFTQHDLAMLMLPTVRGIAQPSKDLLDVLWLAPTSVIFTVCAAFRHSAAVQLQDSPRYLFFQSTKHAQTGMHTLITELLTHQTSIQTFQTSTHSLSPLSHPSTWSSDLLTWCYVWACWILPQFYLHWWKLKAQVQTSAIKPYTLVYLWILQGRLYKNMFPALKSPVWKEQQWLSDCSWTHLQFRSQTDPTKAASVSVFVYFEVVWLYI